jgi:hypothetical protein
MWILYSLLQGDVTSFNNNESAIFRRWKSNLKWRMFHRLNNKGDNSLTEIPGCPEKRICYCFDTQLYIYIAPYVNCDLF